MPSETTFTKATIAVGSVVDDAHHTSAWTQLETLTNKVARWQGHIPAPGRIEYGYDAQDRIDSHTVYDATTGGSVVETATYAYNATTGDLETVTRTRDGQTLTETYTYTSGKLTKVTRTVA